jgi:predicted transcriptional regulator
MPSLTIRLPEHARAALQDLAQVECRSPRDQAAFLILEGLRAAKPAATRAVARRARHDHAVASTTSAAVMKR